MRKTSNLKSSSKVNYSLTTHKFLSDEEYDRLHATLDKFQDKHPRDVAMLFLVMYTGARASEVRAVRKCDLNPSTQTVFIKGLKHSRDRDVPIPTWLFAKLQSIALPLALNDRLFPIALRTMQSIWHQYRPAPKGIKSLRHTFAVRLYKKTKDIRLVQMVLGHRSILNTMIYADFVYSQEEFRKLLL